MTSEQHYNDDDAERGLYSAIDRIAKLAAQGVGVLIRVSSAQQRKHSKGSQKYQRDQIRFLESYGAPTNNLRIFDARGESARVGADRPVFRQLVAAVRRREVHVVLVSDADRISRNDPDAEDLYNALVEVGGLIIINGEIHDPSNSNHRFLLRLRTLIAQYENEQRAFRSLTSKSAKARELAVPIKLATGLVWASPEDRDFVERLREAGMGDLITEEALAGHKTRVRKGGRNYYVFPFPDREVKVACELAVRWLCEEGSLTGLLQRIQSDPQWPSPGHFPAVGCWSFDPAVIKATWKPLMGRADGRDELGRGVLYDWFQSPSIYGIYAVQFPKLRKVSRLAASLGSEVCIEDAFPSFATAGDQQRVAMLLKTPDRPRIRGNWQGERNHALARVFCSHPMPYDWTCGRKLGAMYNVERDGVHRYLAVACGFRGHRYSLPPQIDDHVLDIICSAFNADQLQIELDRIQRSSDTDAIDVRTLQEEISELEAKATWHDHKAFRASREGHAAGVEFHDDQHRQALEALGRKQREIERLQAASDRDRGLSDQEYGEILRLASDLPELLRRARPIEGKIREITRELIDRVYARRIGSHAYQVEVRFHSGQSLARTIIARPIRAPQPIQVLANDRLRTWLPPGSRATSEQEEEAIAAAQALAAELNNVLGTRAKPKWTADRAFTAARMYRDAANAHRAGEYSPPTDLAMQHQLRIEQVMTAALLGRLGPALVRSGELEICPTREELHQAFPIVARRDAAHSAGWPVDDLVTLKRLKRETGWDRYRIERVAARGAGIITDEAGRRYTRRTCFKVPEEHELQCLLAAAIPPDADREAGQWLTWTQAKERLVGVNITTYENHTTVVRPGFGENGLATVYIWVDPQVESRVRKPTLEEAVAALKMKGISAEDFQLRREMLTYLQKRFGKPTERKWLKAVEAGHIIEVRAQGPKSRRLSTYALVPTEVMTTDQSDIIEQFLMGKLK
jgi:DNA invertase Pin-like site-specific DNA recombinase